MISDSFRLKLTLFATAAFGLVLVGFTIFFNAVLHQIGIDRMDQEIRTFAESQLAFPRPSDHWSRLDNSMRFIYGDSGHALIAHVREVNGNTLYISSRWPKTLDIGWDHTWTREDVDDRPHPPPRDGPPGYDDVPEGPGDTFDRRPPHERGRRGPRGRPPHHMAPPVLRDIAFQTMETDAGKYRIAISGSQYVDMAVGISMGAFYADVKRFRVASLVAVPLALVLLALGGVLLARRALRPVQLITQTARTLSASGLDQRVPTTQTDREFADLVDVLNDMLDRLEKSYTQAVRFSADAAHELNTPLTVLQGELERGIMAASDDSEDQRRYNDLLEEVQHLKSITRKLLILSRADAGQLPLDLATLDFGSLIETAIEDVDVLAPGIAVDHACPANVQVRADQELIQHAVQNLVHNACKYNRPDGWITVTLVTENGMANMIIANASDQLRDLDAGKIFERFYRGNTARTRNGKVGGTGLGLSLTREIARAHGGNLEIRDADIDQISFCLSVPLADKAS